MTSVLIFANCQGGAIATLLKLADPNLLVSHYHNYTYINNTTLDNTILKELQICDIFIYQPLSTKWPVYNTDNLLRYTKSSCKKISFPYMYNDAFTPIIKTLGRDFPVNGEYTTTGGEKIMYKNIEPITNLMSSGLTLGEILYKYDTMQIDFNYETRFNNTMRILAYHEQYTDVKISDFILSNYQSHRLFNYYISNEMVCCNHPSNVLLVECTNRILHLLGYPSITYSGNELIGAPAKISKYDLEYFKFTYTAEVDDTYTRLIIRDVFNNFKL